MEADLVLLDLAATPLLAQRTRHARDLDEALFAMFVLGDDRAVHTTFVAGREAHRRDVISSAD
jgi:guanine deaminase